MRKRTARELFKCMDDVLSSMEMLVKFKENSYIVSKTDKVCNDNLSVMKEELGKKEDCAALLAEFGESVKEVDVEKVAEISVRIKKIIEKNITYKVVFMPYKASMWDSLESVWMAADKDERCEAIVVPITYYELDSNQNPVKKVNERDEFPEYVPVVNDEEYDLENDRPDIIYIHNPYDDTNLVTRVESRYYSWNLKKYCERLVYIPYYKWIDGVSSTGFKSAMYYADYTVQSSDDAVRRCIEASPEYAKSLGMETVEVWDVMKHKLINLGSPEVDKVVSVSEHAMEMPKKWKGKIRKDKVNVVYNTTIGEIFEARSLEKIRHTLSYFKTNSDKAFVIWRPHPLLKQTLISMIPNLVHEYDEMVNEFMEGKYGVVDDNASMYYSIYWSDMYYGYKTSSMTELYKYTGKVVLNDLPKKIKSETNYDFDSLSNELRKTNSISEEYYSLKEVVDFIADHEDLKKGKAAVIYNSGEIINDYIMKEVSMEARSARE
ncbi:hypothetical protein [Ligilactobacillus ruminis]|uniref:hypothetical protein n=1 Tax=Ligilactobacillus ruminis TaxID=1623 RepID=UPI0022E34924|nr:hypothetical protein [Ligilactobacillus ruminis]